MAKYSNESKEIAKELVDNGMPVYQAAESAGIPYRTLMLFINKRPAKPRKPSLNFKREWCPKCEQITQGYILADGTAKCQCGCVPLEDDPQTEEELEARKLIERNKNAQEEKERNDNLVENTREPKINHKNTTTEKIICDGKELFITAEVFVMHSQSTYEHSSPRDGKPGVIASSERGAQFRNGQMRM